MDSALDYYSAKALLEWQIELGVTESICDEPVDRYEEAKVAAKAAPPAGATAAAPGLAPLPEVPVADLPAEARALAGAATSLEALADAMSAFEGCELKLGARNFVFADGNPKARVMIVGEVPDRDEDLAGKPFAGPAGQLFDKMFAAIGLARRSPDAESALYVTNFLPWRTPQDRAPEPEELAMMLPFAERHIELVDPDVVVFMGNAPCGAFLGRRSVLRIRGKWAEAAGKPVMPMTHPGYLLRNPAAKREAWADLLEIQARLQIATA